MPLELHDSQPRAALFQCSDGSLHIALDGLDHRAVRRRLVIEVGDLSIIAAISSLESDLTAGQQHADGTR